MKPSAESSCCKSRKQTVSPRCGFARDSAELTTPWRLFHSPSMCTCTASHQCGTACACERTVGRQMSCHISCRNTAFHLSCQKNKVLIRNGNENLACVESSVLFQEIFCCEFLSTIRTIPHLALVSFHMSFQESGLIETLNRKWFVFEHSSDKLLQPWFTNFPSTDHVDELVEKVIYTSAGFLFYILVCITLTHPQKVCISYTETGSQEQM